MFWKIFFWVIVVLTLIGMISIANQTPLVFADVLGLILNIILMIGLYVFAYHKKIFTPQIWKIIFWIVIIFFVEAILEIYILPKEFINTYLSFIQSKLSPSPAETVFTWVISLPMIYAIYKLAFARK